MTLRKMLVQFSELVFVVALECLICAAFAKAQPAQPSLRMSSVFPNAARERFIVVRGRGRGVPGPFLSSGVPLGEDGRCEARPCGVLTAAGAWFVVFSDEKIRTATSFSTTPRGGGYPAA